MADKASQFFETKHLLPDIGGHTVRGGAVTILAHGLKFAVGIFATAILARLLTPQDYGLIGMVAVATNFVSMLKDLGLSYPTVQRAEIDFDQINTLFWVNLGMSVALVAIMIAIAPALSWFYGDPRLTTIAVGSQWTGASRIVFFLGIAAFFQPVLNTMGWLFLSQGRSREMLQWSMISAPISIASILCGLPWGPLGVAASYSLTRVVVVNPLVYWMMGRTGPVRTKDLYGHLIPFILASLAAFLACLAFRSFVVLNSTILNIVVSGAIILGTTLAFLLLFPVGRSALLDVKYLLFFLRPEQSFDSRTGGV